MRKGRKSLTCTQIETTNGLSRDPLKIAEEFRNYYKELYSPLKEPHFDEEFKLHIENLVTYLKSMNWQFFFFFFQVNFMPQIEYSRSW
jgi:hypothetical protein